MRKILFVCTGNTCRSSMAQAFFTKMLREKGIKDVEVLSAGIAAFPGDPASSQAVEALREEGIDLSSHQARLLTPELLRQADLILTMTQGHKRHVIRLNPAVEEKTFTLKEYVSLPGESATDIRDPFGQGVDVYRQCAAELKADLLKLLQKIQE